MTPKVSPQTETLKVAPDEKNEPERFAHLGVDITLKKIGDVTVRELTLENTIALAKELSIVFSKIDIDLTSTSERRGFEWIMSLLGDPISQQAIRHVAAASTGRKAADFVDMGLTDWFKVMDAFKSAMDWEEMRELFFRLVPPELIQNWMRHKPGDQSFASVKVSPVSTVGR